MSLEAYIPSSVELNGRPLSGVMVVTIYDPDGSSPHGSLTSPDPPAQDQSGLLEFVGRRNGKEWKVRLPRIRVVNRSALGCEYSIDGPVERVALRELDGGEQAREKGLEERFDIR